VFVDQVKVRAFAGNGGNGCCSFRREAFVPLGGPNGGDGGDGGNVWFTATGRLNTLLDLRYHSHWVGNSGGHGQGKDRHGKKGEDIHVQVPCGTVVRDLETGEVLADLTEEGAQFLAARGGGGGRGNARFATPTNRAPHFAEKGAPGEKREYLLELKLIADVGLVGLPNAGKSTLLSVVSAARPKIADYPFTTLSPNLGVVELSDHRVMTIADIPGIIEGASEGKGLGHDFLRHIERTRVLLFLVDLGDPDPLETLNILKAELRAHSAALADKPALTAFNKADITENRERYPKLAKKVPGALLLSGAARQGVDALLEAVWKAVEAARRADEEKGEDASEPVREYTYQAPFSVQRIPQGFEVTGEGPVRAVNMTDFENDEAVEHLHRRLKKLGVLSALKRMGAAEGQTVRIGGVDLEYRPD